MQKLYYLGPKGTYSEKAALKISQIINLDFDLIPVSTIPKIIEITEKENCFAVLPVENSIEGIVRQTIDNIYLSNLQIQVETSVEINHCLISKGLKNDIQKIVSHPQALAQCQQYILNNFDEKIELIETSSTAKAIQYILDKDNTFSAIASFDAISDLGLNVLDKNIGDVKDNKTRFVLVSKNNIQIAEKNRTSFVFNTKNEAGALYKILSIFKKYNINLVYLESRPSKKVFGEYNFFVDVDCGYDSAKEALLEIEKECNFYKFLGSYPSV